MQGLCNQLPHLGLVNRQFYQILVPEHLNSALVLSIHLPKIEKIKKKQKQIEDLLRWNREVSNMLRSPAHSLLKLELKCDDFKIFNPLNEKLLSNQSFAQLQIFEAGVFDENQFPRSLSEQSILHTPTLSKLILVFTKMQTCVAEVMIRFFRNPDMKYRPTNI
jgi:hypothetical protein